MKVSTPVEQPIPDPELRGLFEYLGRPVPRNCAHDFVECQRFLEERALPVEAILRWLRDLGGACDCEALKTAYET